MATRGSISSSISSISSSMSSISSSMSSISSSMPSAMPLANFLDLDQLGDVVALLRKFGFSPTMWHDLGLTLGLNKNTLDAIERNHPGDVVRCLTECLSQFLRRADKVDSRGGATFDSLSDALRFINEISVADKLDHEKCPHRFTMALHIFDSHLPLLLHLSNPVDVAVMLQKEHIISGSIYGIVKSASSSSKQCEVMLTAIREAVQSKYRCLQTFACVLCKFSDNYKLGEAVLKDYGKSFDTEYRYYTKVNIPVDDRKNAISTPLSPDSPDTSTVEIPIPQCMSDDFTSIQISYGRMLYNVRKIMKNKPPPLEDIKEYLCCCQRNLTTTLSQCSDISDILCIIEKESSLINIRLLQSVVEEFKIKKAEKFVKEYKSILKEFCNSVSISLCLNEKFETLGTTNSLQSETATYVFDWEPEEHLLNDIKQIISKTSGKLVKIKYIKKGNSIIVTCSFSYSLTGAFMKKFKENVDVLIKNGLIKLTVGHFVWSKKIELTTDVDTSNEVIETQSTDGNENDTEKVYWEGSSLLLIKPSRIQCLRVINMLKHKHTCKVTIKESSTDIITLLMPVLLKKRSIKSISIKSTTVTKDVIDSFSHHLEINKSLKLLEVTDSSINDVGAIALIQSLINNESLTSLLLNNNPGITSMTAPSLAELLRKNNTLSLLPLKRTNIGNDGVQLLVESLRSNSTLKKLTLDKCHEDTCYSFTSCDTILSKLHFF